MPDDANHVQLPELKLEERRKHPPRWLVYALVDAFCTMNGVLGLILFAAAFSWALRSPDPLAIAGCILVGISWGRQRQVAQDRWEASADKDVALYAFEHAVREFALSGPNEELARRVSAAAMRCMNSGSEPTDLDEITQRVNAETMKRHAPDEEDV